MTTVSPMQISAWDHSLENPIRINERRGLRPLASGPPTMFQLRAQPRSDGVFEVPVVDLVVDRLDTLFAGLHINPWLTIVPS